MFLTYRVAAQYLGPAFNRRWLRENCIALGIEHVRVKSRFRFTKDALDQFLARYLRKGKRECTPRDNRLQGISRRVESMNFTYEVLSTHLFR